MAKAAIASPLATLGNQSRFCSTVPNRDRARAEPLHGEGEIGERVMTRQRLADDGEAAHVGPPLAIGDAVLEQSGLARAPEQAARHSASRSRRTCRPRWPRTNRSHLVGKRAMARFEERPGEEAAVGHQSPWNTGVRLSANAS